MLDFGDIISKCAGAPARRSPTDPRSRAMNIVIYILSGLFILLALALLFTYYRSRHPGTLLMGATYGAAAALALMLMHWWPLVVGFVSAWALRLMGLDPGQNLPPPGQRRPE